MTIQNLIDWFDTNQYLTLAYFGAIILITGIVVLIANQNNIKSLKYVMSALVYGVTVPGILAVILILYALLLQRTNILNLGH